MRTCIDIHAHRMDAWAWAWAYGCMSVLGLRLVVQDVNSYTWVQQTRMAHAQARSAHKEVVLFFLVQCTFKTAIIFFQNCTKGGCTKGGPEV